MIWSIKSRFRAQESEYNNWSLALKFLKYQNRKKQLQMRGSRYEETYYHYN